MSVSEFTMIRHGQTVDNIKGRLQGHHDSPLDATGLAHAKAIALRLAGEHFDVMYSRLRKRSVLLQCLCASSGNGIWEILRAALAASSGRSIRRS